MYVIKHYLKLLHCSFTIPSLGQILLAFHNLIFAKHVRNNQIIKKLYSPNSEPDISSHLVFVYVMIVLIEIVHPKIGHNCFHTHARFCLDNLHKIYNYNKFSFELGKWETSLFEQSLYEQARGPRLDWFITVPMFFSAVDYEPMEPVWFLHNLNHFSRP